MARILRERAFPAWSALLLGPAVGAGLAFGIAMKMRDPQAVGAFSLGGAIAGLVAGATLLFVDRFSKRPNSGGGRADLNESTKKPAESIVVRFGKQFFAVLLSVIGVVMMVVEGANVIEGLRSNSWPEVRAHIVWVKSDSSPGYKKESFYFWIKYRYRFDDLQYVSERIQFGSLGINSQEELSAWNVRFPKGAETVAYVNPASPESSVLIRGAGVARYFGAFLIGPLMGIAGVCLLRLFWRA